MILDLDLFDSCLTVEQILGYSYNTVIFNYLYIWMCSMCYFMSQILQKHIGYRLLDFQTFKQKFF